MKCYTTLGRFAFCFLSMMFLLFGSSCKKYFDTNIKDFNNVYGGTRDDVGYAIAPSVDGGFVIAGTTYSNSEDVRGSVGSNGEVWVLKINASGDIVWQRTYGGSETDSAYSIYGTSDGGFVIAGSSASANGDVAGTRDGTDAWIFKINGAGDTLWQRNYRGDAGTNDKGTDMARSITQLTDGQLIVVGSSNSHSGDFFKNKGGYDGWAIKLNAGGGFKQWDYPMMFGDQYNNSINVVCATADGGFAMSGTTNTDPKDTASNIWVIKANAEGAKQWEKTFGGSRTDVANSIAVTTDDGFIVAGSTNSTDKNYSGVRLHSQEGGSKDISVFRLDKNGQIIWTKVFGGKNDDVAYSVIATTDGGFLVGGKTNSTDGDVSVVRGGYDAWVLKLDARGNLLWQQSVGGSGDDIAYGLAEIPGKGYIMVGSTKSNNGDIIFNRGSGDVLVATFKTSY